MCARFNVITLFFAAAAAAVVIWMHAHVLRELHYYTRWWGSRASIINLGGLGFIAFYSASRRSRWLCPIIWKAGPAVLLLLLLMPPQQWLDIKFLPRRSRAQETPSWRSLARPGWILIFPEYKSRAIIWLRFFEHAWSAFSHLHNQPHYDKLHNYRARFARLSRSYRNYDYDTVDAELG